MAASFTIKISIAIFLIFLPLFTKQDSIPPILSPFFDNICNDVECGKGTCEKAIGQPFNFVCNCEAGWKKLRDGNETNLEFLPCIIPECSVDYSCMPAPPPAPAIPYNSSFFDPCYWMYCGEGTCTKNSTYTHICQCNPGYSNLLDFPVYPCYGQCSLGSDCANLGIKVDKSSSSSTTSITPNSSNSPINSNHAISLLPRELQYMGFILIFCAMLFRK